MASNAVVAPMREQRVLSLPQLEIRAAQGEPPRIVGYAAVFNSPSEVLADWFGGGFREYIAPGAFSKTLKDGADVRALVNHNPDFVLGRTKSGTLTLAEDAHGLRMEITPPATRWAEDLLTTMQRGDIDGSSFGFQALRERWATGTGPDGRELDERWVLEARLFDVSVVTFPAYPQTESQVRSLLAAAGLDVDALVRALVRGQRGLPVRPDDGAVLRAALTQIRQLLPAEDGQAAPVAPGDHPAEPPGSAPNHTVHPLAWFRDQLTRMETAGG